MTPEDRDLRDMFALVAMHGLISGDWSASQEDRKYEAFAIGAYRLADAMLTERAKLQDERRTMTSANQHAKGEA